MVQYVQISNSKIVGHYNSGESPFPAQDVIQQMFVAVGRYSVNFIVGRHHALHAAFFHCGFERL